MEVIVLSATDIAPDLLRDFDRYEEVSHAWRLEDGGSVLKSVNYIEHWTECDKQRVCADLLKTVASGGDVFLASQGQLRMGFASVENVRFGSSKQYLQLSFLHVSREYRGRGVGTQLFLVCEKAAQSRGAERLYISSSSSENTMRFYSSLGCVPARELDLRLQSAEPYDCQLERDLLTSPIQARQSSRL